ncbi:MULTISPECIES: hypothetical protein [Vibrio]|uniref:hypothetical protein n=1 Tax=Vibrio TaxID=662 RepID=UPI0002D880EC|nr:MULTISPECIES: hypothetical protein [Vibrio]EJL6463832.1 hypothetical protein [Vibrio cholerae]AQM21001.1 hypothetical protein PN51_14400 [Vibrio anguillarum]AUB86017.1 hypothetical protein CKY00_01525 [Vibrio anguillarum]AUB89454.1 hypothetical protein CKX99_01520 [Vibrio anguillarum]AUB92895.1 hypothetical protein CK210_01520 [Vibrio anguillarum]
MYIEIEPAEKRIPQISLKRNRDSNVIKKAELRIYHEARALLMAMEERVSEYQAIVEQQVVQMIQDKEQSLNSHINEASQSVIDGWFVQQKHWLETAEERLEHLLAEQEESLALLKDEIKHSIISAIQSRLTKLSQSDNLICHLIEVLHGEVEDEMKLLKVEQVRDNHGVTLTIENQDSIISINTAELVNELHTGLGLI